MNVKEFLIKFKSDLDNYNDDERPYHIWQQMFFNKTAQYHKSVLTSYFEQVSKIIDETNYHLYHPELVHFAHLELFAQNDQASFSNLINKLTENLNRINTPEKMEETLNFIYSFVDFIFHYIYPHNAELVTSVQELKSTILKTKSLDEEDSGKLVIRFIDLIISPKDKN